MSDIGDVTIPEDEGPAEAPEAVEEEAVVETTPEEAETAVEAPVRWRALTTVRYQDPAGNEFFCGPGEMVDDEFAGQIDPGDLEPAG